MKFQTFPRHLGFLVPVFLFFCPVTYADVLVLTNGDRITGQIKRIWDARISIKPEYSDEFKVDVSAVSHIESTRDFEIELDDGRSMEAQLAGADAAGNQIVKTIDELVSVPLTQVFELDEPKKDFEWESNVEVSANINKGNTETVNAIVRANSTVRIYDHRHLGELSFFREQLADVSTKERDLFKYSYNWLYSDAWFLSTDLTYERDPIIQLERRVIASAGLGRDIWDSPRRTLNVKLGAGYQTEKISLASTDSTVLTWTLRYRQDFFSDDVELFHNQTITSNITGRTNTSYQTSTGLGYEITDLLSAIVSLDFDYETNPVDVAENEDIVFLVGIGAEF